MSDVIRNKAILKEAFDKWDATKGGSVDHWMSIMDDRVKFKSLADGASGVEFTDQMKSKDELRVYFQGLETIEMVYYKIDHYIAEGDKVVALGKTSWKSRSSDMVVTTPKCDVVRFKDGLIVSFYEFYNTTTLIDLIADASSSAA